MQNLIKYFIQNIVSRKGSITGPHDQNCTCFLKYAGFFLNKDENFALFF